MANPPRPWSPGASRTPEPSVQASTRGGPDVVTKRYPLTSSGAEPAGPPGDRALTDRTVWLGCPGVMSARVNDKRRYNADGTPRAGMVDPEPASAPEGPPTTEGTPAQPDEVSQLRAELEAARRRVDELARGIQDVMRDRDEFKQRIQRERDRLVEVEKGQVAQALIEAVDELD